jgi:hypothetical protein
MDATLSAVKRLGSFLWLNHDHPEASALLPLFYNNFSGWLQPPGKLCNSTLDQGTILSMSSCPAGCACPSRAVIIKHWAWEVAYAAFREDFARVTVLTRWLGAAAVNISAGVVKFNLKFKYFVSS